MTTVFQPLRDEPMFLPVPGVPTDQFRLTVRWTQYFDQLGDNSNETDEDLEYEISAVQSEIQKTQAFTAELSKRDDDLDALIQKNNYLLAVIRKLENRVESLEEIEISKLNAKLVKLQKKVNNLEVLV